MQRGSVLALIIILSIFVGVMVVVQETNHPLLLQIAKEQAEILDLQRRLSGQTISDSASGKNTVGTGNDAGTVAALLKNQLDIQQKVNGLDRKIDSILVVMQAGLTGRGAGVAQQQPPGPPPEEYTKVYDIDKGNSPVRGKKDAPVTITEFVDFQCPYCAHFHSLSKDVLDAYPDKVNYVLKNFPLSFHPQAKPAAKAALAAGEQGKYWEMVDSILADSTNLSDQKFEELAKKIGLNVKTFLKDYKEKDADYEKILADDMQLGGTVDVRGTPTFYLNGRKTIARDPSSLQKEIDEALKGKK